MKKLIFALFCICIIAFSCKKSDPDPVAPTPSLPYSNSNDGTNWRYEVRTVDQVTTDTITTNDTSHVAKPDTTVGSKAYVRIIHNDGTHTYNNVTGNDYYQFQHIVFPPTVDTSIEIIYLKDNGSVGTSWAQPLTVDVGIGFPITITFTSTITGTGLTRVVKGITYSDVISVSTALNSPGITITSNIVNYYARNIGLIEGVYDIDVSGFGKVYNDTKLLFSDPH